MQNEVGKYRTLPIELSGIGPPARRYIYFKPHVSEHDGLPKDRALYVTGVPAQLHGTALVELFARFGDIERAALHSSGLSAVLLYAAADGREKLFKAAEKGKAVAVRIAEPTAPWGLKGWVEQHKALTPGNTELQQELDDWVEQFEAEEEARRAESLRAQQDDGWTVVQRHKGRKMNASSSGITVGGVAAAAAQAQLRAKRDNTHRDFYRFQQREQRRSELLELRQRFELDKKRIAELQAVRRFKPY